MQFSTFIHYFIFCGLPLCFDFVWLENVKLCFIELFVCDANFLQLFYFHGVVECLTVLIDMASRRQVRYSPLSQDDDNGREDDLRFSYNPKALDRIPWKSIALALFLLSLGCLLLFLSVFIFTGHMGGDQSQAYGLLMLGILSFLPGMVILWFLPFSRLVLKSLFVGLFLLVKYFFFIWHSLVY